MKIKKNDTVKVITGKDKGKEGKVIAVTDGKVLVEGVNMISKHSKANQNNPKGGIIHQEAPIDVSNVMYLHKGKPTRVGFKTVESKKGPKKVRFAKTTGDVID
ncbi:50S ribosomal protein L24 [Lachnospiraceae bacterium MD1]|jgi:large subunit ribosomal protein L24|uniref:Large ribosomal subunit protein uL24 n=2 Tax=Variimorphobacter saccharofermentans TaxID=2755051 RepID=A0A839K5E2_9FIRM|nr:50S ribosomal protein L24 [Variimorphobacter saccharofermentans]